MASWDDRFEQIYRELYPRIVAYLRQFFPNPEDAREVAQNAFQRVWEHGDIYGTPESDEAMVKTIARRLALNKIRSGRAQKRDVPLISIDEAPIVSTQTPDPEQALGEKEKLQRIADAIEQLPPRWRICVLHRLAGLSYKEIAALLDTSVDSVKACLYEARQRLGLLLGKDAEGFKP